MSRLRRALSEYLALRRGLGFKLKTPGQLLESFVAHLDARRISHITTDTALRWARLPQEAHPSWWSMRMRAVRQFAQYLSASDPRTEVPPHGLLQVPNRRAKPYIYSDRDVSRLLDAAGKIRSRLGFKRRTYPVLFGLLSISGLRIRELLNLDREAVDLKSGVLTIRGTKFGKTRYVPLHRSVTRALARYARRRDDRFRRPKTPAFFVGDRGTPITLCAVRWNFLKLSRRIGLRGPKDGHGPRLHDFRHRFAVRTLVRWYRAGVNVDGWMPTLSTYLGHLKPKDTYWYLSATPALFRQASAKLEKTWGGLP
jgi:integrase/recombinase XerD